MLYNMKVFVSHAFADDDKELASILQTNLMEQGIKSYLAEKNPEFGKDIGKKIEKEISDSDCLVAIYTNKAKGSASVNHEIGYARGKHVRIIIMLEKGVTPPILLAPKEAEEFTRENFEEHCKRVRTFLLEKMGVKIKEIQKGKTLRLVKGDITKRKVDVIVNSANSYLKHHGGVAEAIVRNGGYVIQKESKKIGFVPVGEAVITTAGKLPCKAIIHAVGPRMGEGDEDNKLKNAVINSLTLATQKGFRSISMPAISSGIYRFPKDKCAEILFSESKKFFHVNPQTTLETIEFCIYDNDTLRYFTQQFERI